MNTLPGFLRSNTSKVILAIASMLACYSLGAATLALLTDNGLAASAGGAVAAVLFAVLWRRSRRRRDDPFVALRPAPALPISLGRAGSLLAMLTIGFVAGQAASQWWYSLHGSPSFDGVQEGLGGAPAVLTVLFVLLVAPIGEEAMLRGVVYPALRRVIPAWLSALAVTAGFALLHGNAVQAIATLPLGVLLAIAYEERNSLLAPMVLHVLFNAMALLVPVAFVAAFMRPLAWVPMLVAFAALAAYEMRRQASERRLSP